MGTSRLLERAAARLAHALLGDDQGLVELPIVRGAARGLKLRVDLRVGGEGSYILGRHEPQVTAQLTRLIRPGWTVWDCGSHIGFFSLLFARGVGAGGRVIAFEPDPKKLGRTRENARLNGFDQIECVPLAIAGDEPEIEFEIEESTTSHMVGTYVGAHPHLGRGPRLAMTVPAISLDAAIQRFPEPDLVKLDIEGAEVVALQHAKDLLGRVRPILAVELHNPQADALLWSLAQQTNYQIIAANGDRITQADRVGGHVLLQPE